MRAHALWRRAAVAARLIEIKADDQWVATHAIDWAKAVVTMVPLRGEQNNHV
jgi:hypothetical protein